MDSTTPTSEPVVSPTLLFRVGTTTYGCDVGATQEIIPLRAATRLPGAPAWVLGLINLRGTIVTVLDVGVRLDASRRPATDGAIVLARHGDRVVGLVVEEVLDVRALAMDAGDEPDAGGIVRGMANVDGRAVIILDLDTLISQVLLS